MRLESMIIGAVGLLVGSVIGGGIGYFWSEAKYRKRSEEEYNNYRELMKRKKAETEAVKAGSAKSEEKPVEEPKTEEAEKVDKEEIKIYRDKSSVYADPQQRKEEEVVNYSGYSSSKKPKEEKPPEDLSPKEMDGIYKITEDQFDNEYIGRYGKEHLTYYVKSHELFDDAEESVDIDEVCGWENLSKWPEGNHLFVRNVPSGVDYDIEFLDEEYYHWK